MSGVIAAALNNGTGGAGVAPEAGLVGYRIGFGANGTLEQLVDAFELLMAVDVANNSWGFDGYFGDNSSTRISPRSAMRWRRGAAGSGRSSSWRPGMGGLRVRT